MCHWQKCEDARIAERDAEEAHAQLAQLRTAVEDHRRGVLDDDDLYAIVDGERVLAAQRSRWIPA